MKDTVLASEMSDLQGVRSPQSMGDCSEVQTQCACILNFNGAHAMPVYIEYFKRSLRNRWSVEIIEKVG